MAVPLQRDPTRVRAHLAAWLTARPGGAFTGTGPAPTGPPAPPGGPTRWEVGEPAVPAGVGFSAENLLVDAHRTGPDGRRTTLPLVVRLAPGEYRVYPWDRFAAQCRVLEALHRHTDVPVPPVYGYEADPAVLGAPFLVLGRVAGTVPADLPSYHRTGWVAELAPERRARLWDAAIVAMARIHRLDPGRLGLGAVDQPEYGPVGAAQQLAAYERHLGFFGGTGEVVAAALSWLHDHPPAERHPPRLLWGDARLGNIVFRDVSVAALLDWEMVTLGQPEADLAWFLHLDRHLSEGIGAPRLPGLPDRAATVARFSSLLGRPVEDLDHHAVSAALRFALIAARVTRLVTEHGVLPAGTDLPLARNAARLLARVLDEARSSPAAAPGTTPRPALDRSSSWEGTRR